MKHRLHPGDHMPEFSYDTPYEPQNSFYALLEQDERPLFMVFLRNFGHPFTRHYIVRYAQTFSQLYSARLVCVVQTRPETIGPHLPKGTMPYPVICDAEGALYDYFEIPRIRGRMRTLSWEGLRILKEAEKQGYQESKEVAQQMPLTLLIAPSGEVLLAHYGASVTDQPESCEAMETVCQEMRRAWEKERRKAQRRGGEQELLPDGWDEEEEPSPFAPARRPQESSGTIPLGPDAQENAPARPSLQEVPIRLTEPLDLDAMGLSAVKQEEPAPADKAQPAEGPAPTLAAAPEPAPAPAPEMPAPADMPEQPELTDPPTAASAPPDSPPAAPAPQPPVPPVVPAITSPSGSAAEDLALQKFRSAAATLFSDEF